MGKAPSIPGVPSSIDPATAKFLSAVKERLEILFGERGSLPDALLQRSSTTVITTGSSSPTSSYAQKGVNKDITELRGLVVPLSIAQGGTGGDSLPTIPPGVGALYFGTVEPDGWLFANGRTLLGETYPELYKMFGNGDGTFTLPDMRGRVPVGLDGMGENDAGRVTVEGSGIDGRIMGATGGEQSHTLIIDETPAHAHTYTNTVSATTDVNNGTDKTIRTITSTTVANTSSQGGGLPHNNMQPSIMVGWLIKT